MCTQAIETELHSPVIYLKGKANEFTFSGYADNTYNLGVISDGTHVNKKFNNVGDGLKYCMDMYFNTGVTNFLKAAIAIGGLIVGE